MKINVFARIITLFIMFIMVAWNCSTKVKSFGEDDLIYVFADSSEWIDYQEPLNNIFGKYIRTPILEREFILQRVPFEKFDQYKQFKNIFFLANLSSSDPISANVKNLLNEEIIAGVRSGSYFYIPKRDVWAADQYVLFLVAESKNAMIQKILDLGELAYNDYKNYYYQRLKEQMFARMEQKDLQKYIEKHFPFTMRIQHDYFIADEHPRQNYVWIRRVNPDRSILVHWLPRPENFQLTSRWVIDERNRLADIIYSGDVIVEEETRAFAVKFKKWQAVNLRGTWRNDSLVIGGPFRNYTFVDNETDRIYMIDSYVQAIGRRKKPFLDQLYVIVHTFDVLNNSTESGEIQ